MMENRIQILEVWGELACFTRPEMKVERFSYPIMTPSAARGIFDAIYCKPVEFRWQILRIESYRPPAYIALRRNEVKEKASETAILSWATGKSEPEPIWADGDREWTGSDTKGRTQRQTMALRDVRYRLHARVQPWPGHESKTGALESQFRRRAAMGKCVYQPCFGCREFPAYFELVEEGMPAAAVTPWDAELGWMIYDVFDLAKPGHEASAPRVSLFRGVVRGGAMEVPEYESPEVRKSPVGRG
jgi:CRISPR-associated protein Cas5d